MRRRPYRSPSDPPSRISDGERQHIAVEDPLQSAGRSMQITTDIGQRDIHDSGVQKGDPGGQHRHGQHPATRSRVEPHAVLHVPRATHGPPRRRPLVSRRRSSSRSRAPLNNSRVKVVASDGLIDVSSFLRSIRQRSVEVDRGACPGVRRLVARVAAAAELDVIGGSCSRPSQSVILCAGRPRRADGDLGNVGQHSLSGEGARRPPSRSCRPRQSRW